jgi:hypothetical protein
MQEPYQTMQVTLKFNKLIIFNYIGAAQEGEYAG